MPTLGRRPLNILALDTSSDICAAALVCGTDSRVFTRDAVAHNKHSDVLLPMVSALLSESGLSRREIGAVAVGIGPGSFTGIRIAVSVGQGIATALDVPMIAIDSLMALAEAARARHAAADVVAALDARMQQVFAARYGWSQGEWVVRVAPLQCALVAPDDRLKGADYGVGTAFAVDGASAASWAAELGLRHDRIDRGVAVEARCLATLAMRSALRRDLTTAEAIAPMYVREKVAATIAERSLVSA